MAPHHFRMALLPKAEYLALKKLRAEVLRRPDGAPLTQKDVICALIRHGAATVKVRGAEPLQDELQAYLTTAPSETEALL